jgi:peptidoglycan-N-acetylglucosamine deacetylase
MLTFRNTNVFFVFLLAVLISVHIQSGLPYYIYLLLFITWSLIVFRGCISINSGFFFPVICGANTEKKEISISFDDGPAENYTREILKILKDEDVKAAFFCIGNRIAGNETILQEIDAAGHIIGNHSYSHHFWFDMFSAKRMLNDLKKMDEAMFKAVGYTTSIFRPPYGVTNPNLRKAVISGQYIPIGWSVRSMDTVSKDEEQLLNKLCARIEPGGIFLFHDTCKITLDILPKFIKEVKNRGYNIIPLDKLLALQPYA